MTGLRRPAKDAGQATIILLMMLVVGMFAMTILFLRVGHANFMRSNAKEAADAAALAGASAVRDRAITSLQANAIPGPLFPDMSSRAAANQYAQANNAKVTGYQAGVFTPDVMVTVESQDCVFKNQEPFHGSKPCPQDPNKNTQKELKRATASSVATVEFPNCVPKYSDKGIFLFLTCNNQPIAGLSRADLAGFFNVHLKDSFNRGSLAGFGPGGVSNLPPPTAGHAPQNMKIAQGKIAKYGWGSNEFECLVQLWTHESNWNETAQNKAGGPNGAYGIPQALPPSKLGGAALSGNWPANAEAQIDWGLNYIRSRYTTPCAAWAFWQHPTGSPAGASTHWY